MCSTNKMQRTVFYMGVVLGTYMINSQIYGSFKDSSSSASKKPEGLIQAKPDTTIIWVVKIMAMFVVNVLILCSVLFYARK